MSSETRLNALKGEEIEKGCGLEVEFVADCFHFISEKVANLLARDLIDWWDVSLTSGVLLSIICSSFHNFLESCLVSAMTFLYKFDLSLLAILLREFLLLTEAHSNWPLKEFVLMLSVPRKKNTLDRGLCLIWLTGLGVNRVSGRQKL